MTTSVATAFDGGDVVLTVAGEIDAASWDAPVEAAEAGLAAHPAQRLVVDLADVTFLDSSGLGALVRIRNLCHSTGVPLTLRGVSRSVRKLLVATGLDTVFDVSDVSGP